MNWGKVAIAAALLALGFYLGGLGPKAEFAKYRTKMAEKTAEVAQLATKASELARVAEHDHSLALAAIGQQYERGKADAESNAAGIIRDLESGALRLRAHWAAERATDKVTDAATAARVADEQAQLRREGAAALVRLYDEADRQIEGLQAVILEDRKQLNPPAE